MNRRELWIGLLAAVPLAAQGQGNGRGRGRGKGNEGNGASPDFRPEDRAAIQRYYSGPRDLPPGLRKKYYRTGKLPPGWEKKMQPFPPELVRVLPPPPPNCERGYIDGVAVVYDRKTRVILDCIDLIAAFSGR